jgi:hypothetical protein
MVFHRWDTDTDSTRVNSLDLLHRGGTDMPCASDGAAPICAKI